MKPDTAKLLTLIMLIVSSVITVAMAIFAVMIGIIAKVLFPILFLLLFAACWLLVDLHYLNCYRWLRSASNRTQKKQAKLRKESTALTVIMAGIAVVMSLILVYLLINFGFFVDWYVVYFLIVVIVATAYAVNNTLIRRALQLQIEPSPLGD